MQSDSKQEAQGWNNGTLLGPTRSDPRFWWSDHKTSFLDQLFDPCTLIFVRLIAPSFDHVEGKTQKVRSDEQSAKKQPPKKKRQRAKKKFERNRKKEKK